jgi:phosphoribosyl-AMP cyclohydrolase
MSDNNESIDVEVVEKKKYYYSPEKRKQYYESSKNKHTEPIKCECGKYYTYFNFYNHSLTNCHLEHLQEKVGKFKNI